MAFAPSSQAAFHAATSASGSGDGGRRRPPHGTHHFDEFDDPVSQYPLRRQAVERPAWVNAKLTR